NQRGSAGTSAARVSKDRQILMAISRLYTIRRITNRCLSVNLPNHLAALDYYERRPIGPKGPRSGQTGLELRRCRQRWQNQTFRRPRQVTSRAASRPQPPSQVQLRNE